MFWSVAASKAAAAINNKIASKCSISTVCQLSSLAGLMVELCLSFRNSKLISKQSSSSNMDCSILPENNKLCSPPPAPGNTGAPHVIYSPVPCFLPETSSEKNSHSTRAEPDWTQEFSRNYPEAPPSWSTLSAQHTDESVRGEFLLVMREFMMTWVALAFTTGTLFTLSVDDEGVMTGFMLASPSSSCGKQQGTV